MPDFANMTEEEQIAFAMQMSMQDARKFIDLYINYHLNNLDVFFLSRTSSFSTSKTSKER